MKKFIKNTVDTSPLFDENTIHVVMYLYPIIYTDISVYATAGYNPKDKKYHTDINPARVINGPLSGPGEELEPPISTEWDGFIDDCKWLVKELGFTIIHTNRSDESDKSEYIITYGIDKTPCGTIVYDLRLSDHPFDATFPEELKDKALEFLTINKILDGTATKEGIDFQVEKVTVGAVRNDTWDRAFNRLYLKLKEMRRKVKTRLNERDNKDI